MCSTLWYKLSTPCKTKCAPSANNNFKQILCTARLVRQQSRHTVAAQGICTVSANKILPTSSACKFSQSLQTKSLDSLCKQSLCNKILWTSAVQANSIYNFCKQVICTQVICTHSANKLSAHALLIPANKLSANSLQTNSMDSLCANNFYHTMSKQKANIQTQSKLFFAFHLFILFSQISRSRKNKLCIIKYNISILTQKKHTN